VKRGMKKLYVTYLFFLIGVAAYPQAPDWLWAKSAGGKGWDKAYSIASDNAGNLYVTGVYYSPSIIFDTDTFVNPASMFLVKYDSNGNIIWAKSSTGSNQNYGNCLTTDNTGNVYVAGYFSSNTISFDSIILTRNDTTVIWSNLFLVKYDSAGNVIWAKNATKGSSTANAVTADNLGNIFVAGGAGIDTLVIGPDTLYPNSYYDIFVAKYDTSGNPLWARGISAGGVATDVDPPFIAADKFGNVYVTGPFHNPTCVIVSTILVNQGDDNIYLAKFNGGGNLLWAKRYGASGHDDASSVATDTSGNIYITGSFTSTNITFDSFILSGNGYTGFVVKLNSSGTAQWAKKMDKLYTLANLKVKVNFSEDVFVTGYFNSSALLFTPTDSLVNKGLFLSKYDNNGNFKWARDAIGGNRATDVTVDDVGNPYITGYFSADTLIFDSTVLLNDTTPGFDIFVAAINTLSAVEEYNTQNINDFSVFPNPSQGRFYIKTKGNQSSKILIYDMMGKEKFNKTINHEMEQIDLSSCGKGIYFVTIDADNKRDSRKMIIQ
jgi:hypothetical protein